MTVTDALDALGFSYEALACDPALADTAAYSEAYRIPLDRCANTLVVVSKRGPQRVAACVALAGTRLDVNGAVRDRLGAPKVSFAGPDDTAALTGMELGGVAPFGLPDDMPVLVDARVLDHDWVIVGGGTRDVKLRLDPRVFSKAPRTSVVAGLAV
jgi:prolyl-tRNA editing enzyme YbaK/EbsC (Cys-tRNA(Pro) deacylase)